MSTECGGGAGSVEDADATCEAVRLRVRSPADLVAAVPYLLGFHPRESLVVVGTQERWVALTSRVDLPPPEQVQPLAEYTARVMAEQGSDEVLLVIVAESSPDRSPPRPDLVDALRGACERAGLGVWAAVSVPEVAAGVPWRCYGPCACAGQLPDPASSPVAAAAVAAGRVTFPDRGALERLVDPADPAVTARRSALLDAHIDRECDRPPAERAEPADLELVRRWVRQAGAGGRLDLDDDAVVGLCVALSDPVVRDAAFGLATRRDAAGAERLWTALVRAAPDPEAAEAAVLLAHCALLRGDGALAGIALARAQRAWPGHRLSELLQSALDGGLGPDELARWFAAAAAEATESLRRRGY